MVYVRVKVEVVLRIIYTRLVVEEKSQIKERKTDDLIRGKMDKNEKEYQTMVLNWNGYRLLRNFLCRKELSIICAIVCSTVIGL